MYILNREDFSDRKVIQYRGNLKRLRLLDSNTILVNGNSEIGVIELDLNTYEHNRHFREWILNTPENAIYHQNHCYVLTYGYQINTYEISSGELIESQFTAEDYPKALAMNEEESTLIVGGRGFISTYDISNIVPSLIKTLYI